jgi:hypothetical protein
VADAGGLAGSLDPVAVVVGSFHGTRAGAVPPAARVDLAGDLGVYSGSGAGPVLRGKGRRTGGGVAGDAQGAGEGDPVGIDGDGVGGLGDQVGERVADQQPGLDLLVDQLGQLRFPRSRGGVSYKG